MSKHGVTFYRWDDMPKEQVTGGLSRRLITGERMMLAHVYLKKGCVVPRHQHENEQLTYVVEGALHFWIGEDESEEIVMRRRARCCICRRGSGTRPRRSTTRSTSTSSVRRARTGWRRPTTT